MSDCLAIQPAIRRLGSYEVHELLGMGSMGAVYHGYQPNLKRYIAIKVLPPHLSSEKDYLKRFNREAETAAQLEHPGIVPIYDYGIENGVAYIVMRLMTGGTLSDRLRELARHHEMPSLHETAALLRQLAGPLDYAHSKGVVHRDLKPGNIIFDDQGNAFLADFGIAKLLNTASMTGTGLTMGTPSYMAPEQWLDGDLCPATDQYSLGVILYSMIEGCLPFEAATAYGLMRKHISEVPPCISRPGIPDMVITVLDRAMAKKPQDRYPSITAFADDFERAVQNVTSDQHTGLFLIVPPPDSQIDLLKGDVLGDPLATLLSTENELMMAASTVMAASEPRSSGKRRLAWVVIFLLVALSSTGFIVKFAQGTGDQSNAVVQVTATKSSKTSLRSVKPLVTATSSASAGGSTNSVVSNGSSSQVNSPQPTLPPPTPQKGHKHTKP